MSTRQRDGLPTSLEAMYALTGGDEDAIAKTYKTSISTLQARDHTLFLRALLYIRFRRGGAADARQAAAELTIAEVMDSFADTGRLRAKQDEQLAAQLAEIEETEDPDELDDIAERHQLEAAELGEG